VQMACLHHLLNHFPYLIPLIYLSLSFWFCPWRTQYSPELFSSLILSNPLPGLRAPATQGHPFLSLRQNACPGLPTPSLHLVPTLPHNFPWPTSGAPPLPSQMEAAPSLAGNTYNSSPSLSITQFSSPLSEAAGTGPVRWQMSVGKVARIPHQEHNRKC
jgi:hypothetical protein